MDRAASSTSAQQRLHSARAVLGASLFGVALGSLVTAIILQSAPRAGTRFLLAVDPGGAGDIEALPSPGAANLEPSPKVCAVVGVGPGIGEHLARRFARASCRVALLARDAAKIEEMSKSIPGSKAYVCDATNATQVEAVFSAIMTDMGVVDSLMYNVGGGHFQSYENLTQEGFEFDFQSNAMGLLLAAKQVGPGMAARGHGSIGVTGATSSWRGLAYTAGFAPGKFAMRGLAESLAKDLGPKGVHVFHVVVDGGVYSGKHPEKATDMLPEDIAETYYNLAVQPRSAWTFEVSLFAWADKLWYTI